MNIAFQVEPTNGLQNRPYECLKIQKHIKLLQPLDPQETAGS